MGRTVTREIPYNYTSADDRRILALLLGHEVLVPLERLAAQHHTGRASRLLMRFVGDLFIHHRNPFLYQELLDNRKRQQHFIDAARRDLALVAEQGNLEFDPNPDLNLVLEKCRQKLNNFCIKLFSIGQLRSRIRQCLGTIVGEKNIFFDPFTLAAHATDATDWRSHLPLAVVYPHAETQVPLLLKGIGELGLKAIPRGGGTGLTGGAVPVAKDCIIINTEKLNRIIAIKAVGLPQEKGETFPFATIELEAGVITDDAMQAAEAVELVFATDPTSAWACTIGGNIAENAGGKRAVLWGTAIDNLLSFRIAVPGGQMLEVKRLNPTGMRIDPKQTISFAVTDMATGDQIKQIVIPGEKLRKPGLGKDITNKTLEGLPGIQKEGTDGIITSAVFILHRPYPCQRTICLEFFGEDMEEAAQVIDQISLAFAEKERCALMALEHFDEEYVRTIQYKAKAPSSRSPKAVLLIDIVGHTTEQVTQGLTRLTDLLEKYPNSFMAIAKDEKEASRFWRDRKRLGAIAARTNAFKLNEDIVLPLKALAEFAEFVDHLNVEEERSNQQEIVWQLLAYLERAIPIEDPDWLKAKLPKAQQLLKESMEQINLAGRAHLRAETHLRRVQTFMTELLRGYNKVQTEIQQDIDEIRSRRIVVATHMHAGDGNVHVNIPVFSNDREMMLRAAEVADIIMEKTVNLNGVVSGEHGIGFTKIKHLDADILAEFKNYQRIADPENLINPDKLTDRSVTDRVFTPSFNLIELEARILRYGHLEQLAEKISQCVRCGRCKTPCCVFYPSENLFYHPRNKNLALTGIIEALLYDAQRFHMTSLRPSRWLVEVADHCTLCHKCQTPCPVNIDTAEVSILERQMLTIHNAKKTALPTKIVLNYLSSRSKLINGLSRWTVLQGGGMVQRYGARVMKQIWQKFSILAPFYAPSPPISAKTLYASFPKPRSLNHTLLISPEKKAAGTVFYFPGCGSERMHTDIALAAIFLLLNSKMRVVLPPPFLCCGFPARANAKIDHFNQLELRNTIIFSQIRSMLGYLSFDACIISCGTCREGLMRIDTANIFDATLFDVSAFVLNRDLNITLPEMCYYHQPCHDSLDGEGETLLHRIAPNGIISIPHCCSEAGTLALSRPDIAAAMLARKRSALMPLLPQSSQHHLLTNCPACLNGLGRQRLTPPKHLAVALADTIDNNNWRQTAMDRLSAAELVRF